MRRLIRADGTSEDLAEPQHMDQLLAQTGAKAFDTVALKHLGFPLNVLLVNDQANELGLPVNTEATALYHANCLPGVTWQIRGDAVVVPDEDFADR